MLCKATNEIASFCIDNRLRQMAFFVFTKVGKGRLLNYVERFWIKKASSVVVLLFFYYKKQIDSTLPCVSSVINHRKDQSVVRTSVTHLVITSCATFLFLPHFDVSCELLLNRCMATWNLFIYYIIIQVILAFWLVLAYDLLEDRRTIDVIITEFLPLPF